MGIRGLFIRSRFHGVIRIGQVGRGVHARGSFSFIRLRFRGVIRPSLSKQGEDSSTLVDHAVRVCGGCACMCVFL